MHCTVCKLTQYTDDNDFNIDVKYVVFGSKPNIDKLLEDGSNEKLYVELVNVNLLVILLYVQVKLGIQDVK